MKVSYTKHYKNLCKWLANDDVVVIDGCETACVQSKCSYVIFIGPQFGIKERFYLLIHEMGHIYKYKNKKNLAVSKRKFIGSSEIEADTFALEFLVRNSLPSRDYIDFLDDFGTRKYSNIMQTWREKK